MESERNQETNVKPEELEDKHNRKTVTLSLALTSLGFLILEGVVCLFSQRTDPWHGYLWFATVAVLGTGVMAVLLRPETRCSKEQLLHALLVVVLTVHLFAACLYLWLIFDAAGTSELFQSLTVLIPALLLVVIFLVARDAKSLRVLHGFRGLADCAASVEISLDTWHSVTTSLSFALVIVLAFAWSFSSSFSFYYGERFGTFDFSILKPSSDLLQSIRWYAVGRCVQETIIRLCPLSIVHAFTVHLCRIRSPRIRAGATVCGFVLAAWGYAFLLTLLMRNASAGAVAIALVVPPIAPFAYALLLSYRVRTRLSE
ncbi:MAG: hypothetical protein WAW16_08935 [Candidatus Cryosericum sp.]